MAVTTSLTSKGQVVVPAPIRKALKLRPKDKVKFSQQGGKVYLEKAATINTLYGSLHNSKVKPLSTQEMKKMIEKDLFSDR